MIYELLLKKNAFSRSSIFIFNIVFPSAVTVSVSIVYNRGARGYNVQYLGYLIRAPEVVILVYVIVV